MLSNAVKYSSHGEVVIKVFLTSASSISFRDCKASSGLGGRTSDRAAGGMGTGSGGEVESKRATTATTAAATITSTQNGHKTTNAYTTKSHYKLPFMSILPITTSATYNANKNKVAPDPDSEPIIISHRQQGSQRVSLRDETAAMYLMFEIKDMGIGIAQDVMDALFAPFKQAQRFAGGMTCSIAAVY